jgi:hypothetical protein
MSRQGCPSVCVSPPRKLPGSTRPTCWHAMRQSMEALSSELARTQRDFQQRIEQQTNLLVARQETALTAVKQEVQTTIASLTPERLITSLTGHIETLLQERINVSLAEMRQISTPKVSPETSNIRILTPEKVSRRIVRPESETVRDGTNISRIYALLNEDRNRKPAEIQRLTGIPKATVYRLVERYHRENPVIEAGTMNETETASDEEMRGETETAS